MLKIFSASNNSQLELITFPPPLLRTRLEAKDSPRCAYYEVSVFKMSEAGYLIQKASGAQKSKPNIETWFRPTLQQAIEKKAQLVNAKLNKRTTGRVYTLVG